MGRRGLALGLCCLAALTASPAAAQSAFDAAQSEIAGVLAELEANLTDKEAIEMNFADWQAKADAFRPQFDDLNRRIDETNAYCQGTFEEPEYSRRLDYCNSMFAQLDTLGAQLQPEADAIDRRVAELQARDTARAEAGNAIAGRLGEGIKHLALACIDLPLDQKALCRAPAAPGPRTRDLVAQINADLAGIVP